MHVGLKDVADVLLSALPVDSQGSLKIKQGDATYTNLTPTQDGAMINLTTFICQNQSAMWGSFLSLLSSIQATCSLLSKGSGFPRKKQFELYCTAILLPNLNAHPFSS